METFFNKVYTMRKKQPTLKALVVLSDFNASQLEDMISHRKKLSKKYHIKMTPVDRDLYLLNFQRIIRRELVKGYALLDAKFKGSWILLTDEKSYFVVHVLERLFSGLYPDVSRLYVNFSQIRVLLRKIEKIYNGHAIVTFFVTKRKPRELRPEESLERKGTFLLWEIEGEDELLAQIRKYRVTVDKLDFEVKDEQGAVLLQAHITRKGLWKLRFGNFSIFYEKVLSEAVQIGLGLKRFYSNRERIIKNGEVKLSPFRINYDFDFGKEQLQELANKISKSYSCSIIHSGNPYFVANICDYQDGSSFGVTALGKAVTITPISRATPQAAWRLANVIQELLGDGEIINVRSE
jgi:hypothetical protein